MIFQSLPGILSGYIDAFGRFFYRPLGFTKWIDGLAIIAFIAGCVFLFKQNKRILGIILSPILLTLIAAGLHQYPFQSRLVLFLMPVAIIAIGAGTLYLYRQSHHLALKILSVFLIAILVIPSLWESAQLMKNPIEKSEIKPVIAYIKEHQQPQDLLYIYQRGIYQFKYYAEQYGYRPGDYILGVDDLDQYDGKNLSEQEKQRYQQDLDQLRGNERVWFLFANATIPRENRFIKAYLDQIGTELNSFHQKGAFVYLYRLKHENF